MKLNQVALQLYTLRDFLKTPADIAATLKRVRAIGYQAVQISGLGAIPEEELVKILAGEGLVCCGTHEPGDLILKEPQQVVTRLHKLNTKITAYPWPAGVNFDTLDSVKSFCRHLDVAGKVLHDAGLVLCYHNHHIEFRRVAGKAALEIIYEQTKFVQGEPDTYWIQHGGGDPVEWCDRLGGLPIIHLKDYTVTADNKATYCEIGSGNLNWKRIIAAADATGCQWFAVEQDTCPGDPFESVKQSFEFIPGPPMLRLAAFADEISPNLDVQIEHCRKNDITHFELRGVAGKNVLDFDNALRTEIKRKLADAGMGVVSIGSPIGKVKLSDSWEKHFDRFKISVELAEFFDAPFIRIFSYYEARDRYEVLRRMTKKIEYLAGRVPVLIHENEKDIYGERGAQCLDLHQTLDSPKFKAAFDFANFVQAGENPLDNWPSLKPYTVHIHIKDALVATGQVVPAGQGDGQIAEILKDAYASGYRGFLSLEPHLAAAGQFGGFSGPELFKVAADALKKLCRDNGIRLACDRS